MALKSIESPLLLSRVVDCGVVLGCGFGVGLPEGLLGFFLK
jgi:hypothetical protein